MQVEMIKENADGSAVFGFELTPEETKTFVLLGIKTALLAGIKDAESWEDNSDYLLDLQSSAGLND